MPNITEAQYEAIATLAGNLLDGIAAMMERGVSADAIMEYLAASK